MRSALRSANNRRPSGIDGPVQQKHQPSFIAQHQVRAPESSGKTVPHNLAFDLNGARPHLGDVEILK